MDDQATSGTLQNALYAVEGGYEPTVTVSNQARTVVFAYRDASGLSVRKAFTFQPKGYLLRFTTEVHQGEKTLNPSVQWGPGLGDVAASGESSRYAQKPEGILFRDNKAERLSAKNLTSEPVQEGAFFAAGVDDHYFMSIALPNRPVRVEYHPFTFLPPGVQDVKLAKEYVSYAIRPAQPGELNYFVGPKDFDVARVGGPPPRARHQLRLLRLARRPAAAGAQVGQRLRRQLRLVDHPADDPHQRGHRSRSGTRAWCRCGRCRKSSRR